MTNITNQTWYHVGEVIVDGSSLHPFIILQTGLLIGLAIVGIFLHDCILGYLQHKALGNQSLMDLPNYFYIWINRYQCYVWIMFSVIRMHFVSVGPTFAKLIMWLSYDGETLTILGLGLVALIQVFLVSRPGVIFGITDNSLYYFMVILTCTPLIVINIVCHCLNIYPPVFYALTLQEIKYPLFDHIRNGITFVAIAFFFITRTYIFFTKKLSDKAPSGQLLKTKSIALTFLLITILFVSFQFSGLPRHLAARFASFIYGLIYPTSIIMLSENVAKHCAKQHPAMCKILLSLHKVIHVRRQLRVTPAPNPNNVIEFHSIP